MSFAIGDTIKHKNRAFKSDCNYFVSYVEHNKVIIGHDEPRTWIDTSTTEKELRESQYHFSIASLLGNDIDFKHCRMLLTERVS